jgi:hypothetical protein
MTQDNRDSRTSYYIVYLQSYGVVTLLDASSKALSRASIKAEDRVDCPYSYLTRSITSKSNIYENEIFSTVPQKASGCFPHRANPHTVQNVNCARYEAQL